MTPRPARLLDLTRLVSRMGRGPLTGVDRVELAYAVALLARTEPLFGLVKTRLGFLLLGRNGVEAVAGRAQGLVALNPSTLFARLMHRDDPIRGQAEADARRFAIGRATVPGLGRLLRRHLPPAVSYINVGHTNLSALVFRAVKSVPGAEVSVLVHDVIPLDFPQFTRPGIPAVFAEKMAVVAQQADRVVHITEAARVRNEAQFARFGRVPPGVVAGLGATVATPDAAPPMPLVAPYFVMLGTLEPRKNLGLLLDIWERGDLGSNPPHLYLLGRRGWEREEVFRRLDRMKALGLPIVELSGQPDSAVAAILSGAQALLLPTHAEGFGLPPVEAAALGVPVICSDLPELREVMGDYPVYLPSTDSYSWAETIGRYGKNSGPGPEKGRRVAPPAWEAHFKVVLNLA